MKKKQKITWATIAIKTNKNLSNTILSKTVETDLIDDIDHFGKNEKFYNEKELPYKRGYLLHDVPGTSKTSIIKSIATHYNMDIYLVNMGGA